MADRHVDLSDPGVRLGSSGGESSRGQGGQDGDMGASFFDWVKEGAAQVLSELSKGRRGQIATDVLADLGYAKRSEIQAAYEANPDAIERYFNAIDARALLEDLIEKNKEDLKAGAQPTARDAGFAAAGSALTIALQNILNAE